MELVIAEFNGETQQRILAKMNKEYLSTGKFVKDQMSVSPKILSSLMLSGATAGTVASATMSSSLFMATANPDTLMQIGQGVGSAVVGTNGIVAQAAFIPVASAIPVVAPLIAMQTLSSVVMLQQFNIMDKKLDEIILSIDKMLERQEITKVAELFAAVHIIDKIYLQYGQTGHFSIDMLIRLALAERDAMILSRRYEILENSESSNSIIYGTNCTMLASFLNLRVKYLRTCVDVQENPQFVKRSLESFAGLLKNNINLWDKLLHKSDEMKNDIDKLNKQIEKANPLQKSSLKKELLRKKDEYMVFMEKERDILENFHQLIDSAKQVSETTNKIFPTLIYWHDDNGEHCVATNEQMLYAVA